MRDLMMAALAFAMVGSVARAQDTPVADIAAGYSVIQEVQGSGITANGGSSSVALNVNSWLGAVGDFALYHAAPIAPGLAAGTYTFGPRFSYRRWSRFTPFAQVLLGGVRYSNNGFTFGAGGGADITLDASGRFALRQQVEYFGFRANGGTTNTIRISAGIVFRIGKK